MAYGLYQVLPGKTYQVRGFDLGLIPPTVIIKDDFEEMTVDGVKMVFQNTPGAEQIANGKAKLDGDRKPYDERKALLVEFTMDLEILPGTGGTSLTTPKDHPFEQSAPAVRTLTD